MGNIIWTIFFSLIVICSIVGNIAVLWVIIGNRRMWSVPNYFLANLALADLGMAMLNTMPSFIFMRDGVWQLGSMYCSVNMFTSVLTVNANIFTLVGLTVNRNRAILTPLAPRASSLSLVIGISFIWLLSGVAAVPSAVFSKLVTVSTKDGGKKALCLMVWPDGWQGKSSMDHHYNLFLFMINYLLPLLYMIFAYSRMGCVLNAEVIGESTSSSRMARNKKKKVVKMFALLVFLFGFCWLPYQLYFLISHYVPTIARQQYTKDMYLGFYWLAMINSCINPLIYYVWNERFRSYFDDIIMYWCPIKMRRNQEIEIELQSMASGNINSARRIIHTRMAVLPKPSETTTQC
ncbi:tachykinin-like peptides receptor 86C [Eurytemora carolleeae]|uniref:tachykinin-like peptides receptor 86C n=1 Tax=Eurytemora carolleeae TaxID=1294199 RepID=UPI000C75E927|nr:tachykinin-like peptides receptor 86C [Eurytemora carolleeae]XP_023347621.1 tachykinin-like peptides receptor 86C [Eurytemora carolleeae]|eukprot:XP_023347620.1 tachykinin-like peptides receptor 86C [Eurytemora affinis]